MKTRLVRLGLLCFVVGVASSLLVVLPLIVTTPSVASPAFDDASFQPDTISGNLDQAAGGIPLTSFTRGFEPAAATGRGLFVDSGQSLGTGGADAVALADLSLAGRVGAKTRLKALLRLPEPLLIGKKTGSAENRLRSSASEETRLTSLLAADLSPPPPDPRSVITRAERLLTARAACAILCY